jgi:hypothetical protein
MNEATCIEIGVDQQFGNSAAPAPAMAASRTIRSEYRRNSGTGLNNLTPLVPVRMDQAMPGGVDVTPPPAPESLRPSRSTTETDRRRSDQQLFVVQDPPAYQPLVRRGD